MDDRTHPPSSADLADWGERIEEEITAPINRTPMSEVDKAVIRSRAVLAQSHIAIAEQIAALREMLENSSLRPGVTPTRPY